jgi:O-antigen/teichoic acid export membrane protein
MTSLGPDGQPPSASLTGRTLSGLGWSYLAAGFNAVVQVAYIPIMSRLLDPRAFGLMAIANLTVNFGFYLARMGVAQALIQRPTITPSEIRASATAGWLTGGGFALLLWFTSPQIAGVFDEPDAIPLLRVMALSLLFSGLAMTGQALLRREMRFRELSFIQIGYAVSGAIVGLVAAFAGAGVWSLVYAALTTTVMQFVLQYVRVRHSLRPLFRFQEYKALYSFGARVSLVRLGEFAGKNLDTLAVGSVASTASLGIYKRAFDLVNLPLSQYLSGALTSVLFPGFSRVQTDPERLRRVYLSVVRLGAVVLFPICAGMAVAGREIVLVVLGGQWVDAIVLVPLFAAAAAFNIMSQLSRLLAEARAKLNSLIVLQLGYLVVFGALLALAAVGGGETWMFAAALAAGEVIRHIAYVLLIRRFTTVRESEVFMAYVPAVFAAVLVAGGIAATRLMLASSIPSLPLLGVEIVAGGVSLLVGIRFAPSASR